MTTIQINERPGGIEIHMEGHSGYGKAGEDIVCAALSAVSLFLYRSMLKIYRNAVCYQESEPEASKMITFPLLTCPDRGADAIFTAFLEIVKSLEQQYPEHVKVINHFRW